METEVNVRGCDYVMWYKIICDEVTTIIIVIYRMVSGLV